MADDLSWVPPGVDTRRANVARVYDYCLGGSHNFLADRDLARAIAAIEPNARAVARANRDFLGRAVRFLAAAGIQQFLDIGSGIPTQGNVHEIAQQARPGARVAYVDNDPVVVAHSKAMLAGDLDATIVQADLREPDGILSDRVVQRLIDFEEPVGLMLVAILHFIPAEADPGRIVATLRDALAPGSYMAICHATTEGGEDTASAIEKVYNRGASAQLVIRSRAEILRFFDGFELVEPGLAYMAQWRPTAAAATASDDPSQRWGLVGVGRKP